MRNLKRKRWPERIKTRKDHKQHLKRERAGVGFSAWAFLGLLSNFRWRTLQKKAVSDRHMVALRRENGPTVHEKPGRWSRKAGGRYSQCSFCVKLSVHEKAVVGSRWSLFAVVAEARFYCIIGSAEALPILCVRYFRWERERERERERDGSDVTIVALKLAMNLHFPLLKIRTIGDELTLSLAKNSHFSFLPSHFPSLPSRRGHHIGAEIRNEFTLSIAKKFFALRLCSPSFKWHEPRDEWSKTQDKWSNPAQSYFVLPIEKMNQINTKNYWK